MNKLPFTAVILTEGRVDGEITASAVGAIAAGVLPRFFFGGLFRFEDSGVGKKFAGPGNTLVGVMDTVDWPDAPNILQPLNNPPTKRIKTIFFSISIGSIQCS
jgi:hypothetical protein